MSSIRKLRPLPLFFFIWGAYVPLLLTLLLGDWLYGFRIDYPWTEKVHDFLAGAVALLTVTGIPFYFFWRFSLPFELRKTLPPYLRPSLKNFGIIYWSPTIATVLGFTLLLITNALLIGMPTKAGESLFYAFWFAIFGCWAISYVQTSYLTAKLLRTAELGRTPEPNDLICAFLLVLMGVFGAPFLANRYRALEDYTGEYV